MTAMNRSKLRETALRAVDRLPLLPAVFQRTLGLFSRGDDVSVAELASVVEQDVVIVGHLLATANSALYSRTGSVCSVRQAIARLGINKTRNALLGLSASRPFRTIRLPKSWSAARIDSHSLASAIWSDLLVQKVQAKNAEWAFLTGLLHDVGLLLIAVGLPEQALAMADACSDYQLVEWEREFLGFTHCEIGADLLTRWNCPDVVLQASRFCESNAFEYDCPLSLGMIVKTASLLADANGLSMFESNVDPAFVPDVLSALQIQKPSSVIELFQGEYQGFQSCVTLEPAVVSG
jgi:HD-like signal output (HDOD) protein